MNLYKELGDLKTEGEIIVFESKLIDRFGELPQQAVDLLDSVRIKWQSKKLGLERIVLKQKRMIGYFISDQNSEYYQSEIFSSILKYVQINNKMSVMKERQTKKGLRLLITFIKIDSVETALKILKEI